MSAKGSGVSIAFENWSQQTSYVPNAFKFWIVDI